MVQVLWRRLDVAGHDACQLAEDGGGYTLKGSASFFEHDSIQCLQYRVRCDRGWRAQWGVVKGFIGARSIEWKMERSAAGWTLNGRACPGLKECADLDLGFTPATNLIPLRRASLPLGAAADLPAAWLDAEAGTLTFLSQRYERVSASEYQYASPTAPYEGKLLVTPSGFVHTYPGLWQLDHYTGGTLEGGAAGALSSAPKERA